MTMKVIGAAMPRTGTVSLKAALEILGFGKCYHMTEHILHPEHSPLLAEAPEKPENFDTIFGGYQSTTDYPGCAVWRELADYYPDAKVILTRRDPDKWFDSVSATVGNPQHLEVLLNSPLRPTLERFSVFGADPADRDAAIALFRQYGEDVKAAIAPERLLVFEAKDGWEPLCKFLGVPVPDMPYPRLNDRATMNESAGGDIGALSFEDIQANIREALAQQP